MLPAAPPSLYRWARHRAVRAKHAAVARLRPQPLATVWANIEKPARIGRHRFRGPVSALRTGDRRLQHHLTKLSRKIDQATLHAFAFPDIPSAIVPRQHTERGDQNALRALLSNGPPAPALPQRPFANGCLHADDVPDARARRRTVTAESVDRAPRARGRQVADRCDDRRRVPAMVSVPSGSDSPSAWNRGRRW